MADITNENLRCRCVCVCVNPAGMRCPLNVIDCQLEAHMQEPTESQIRQFHNQPEKQMVMKADIMDHNRLQARNVRRS